MTNLTRQPSCNDVVITPQFLIETSATGTSIIKKTAIDSVFISHSKTRVLLHRVDAVVGWTVTPEIGQAIADWFFGAPVPPPELIRLTQREFEIAYAAYVRAQAR